VGEALPTFCVEENRTYTSKRASLKQGLKANSLCAEEIGRILL